MALSEVIRNFMIANELDGKDPLFLMRFAAGIYSQSKNPGALKAVSEVLRIAANKIDQEVELRRII